MQALYEVVPQLSGIFLTSLMQRIADTPHPLVTAETLKLVNRMCLYTGKSADHVQVALGMLWEMVEDSNEVPAPACARPQHWRTCSCSCSRRRWCPP